MVEELFQKRVLPRADFDKSVAHIEVAQADLASAQAGVRHATIDLGYTEIRAPFTGRVGRRLVDEGNLVGAGESTLLTTIERSLNRIFEARRSRSIGRRLLLYWSVVTLGPLLLAGAAYAGGQAAEAVKDVAVISLLLGAVGWAGPVLTGLVLLAALY